MTLKVNALKFARNALTEVNDLLIEAQNEALPQACAELERNINQGVQVVVKGLTNAQLAVLDLRDKVDAKLV